MAKNRRRGPRPRPRSVFHVAGQKHFKAKGKAKAVTTKLKKINIVRDTQVSRVNRAFVDIQKELAHFSKGLSLDSSQKRQVPQQRHENEGANVDEATRLMAQL